MLVRLPDHHSGARYKCRTAGPPSTPESESDAKQYSQVFLTHMKAWEALEGSWSSVTTLGKAQSRGLPPRLGIQLLKVTLPGPMPDNSGSVGARHRNQRFKTPQAGMRVWLSGGRNPESGPNSDSIYWPCNLGHGTSGFWTAESSTVEQWQWQYLVPGAVCKGLWFRNHDALENYQVLWWGTYSFCFSCHISSTAQTKGSEATFTLVLSLNITLIHPHKVPRRHRKRKLSIGFASLGVTESLTTPVCDSIKEEEKRQPDMTPRLTLWQPVSTFSSKVLSRMHRYMLIMCAGGKSAASTSTCSLFLAPRSGRLRCRTY